MKHAAVYKALGIDTSQVFKDHAGRPILQPFGAIDSPRNSDGPARLDSRTGLWYRP